MYDYTYFIKIEIIYKKLIKKRKVEDKKTKNQIFSLFIKLHFIFLQSNLLIFFIEIINKF